MKPVDPEPAVVGLGAPGGYDDDAPAAVDSEAQHSSSAVSHLDWVAIAAAPPYPASAASDGPAALLDREMDPASRVADPASGAVDPAFEAADPVSQAADPALNRVSAAPSEPSPDRASALPNRVAHYSQSTPSPAHHQGGWEDAAIVAEGLPAADHPAPRGTSR